MKLSMARAVYTVYTCTGMGDTILHADKESIIEALKHKEIRQSMKELIEAYEDKIAEMKELLEESKP